MDITPLLNAFTTLQDKPFALSIFAICFVMGSVALMLWLLLKIIEAVKK